MSLNPIICDCVIGAFRIIYISLIFFLILNYIIVNHALIKQAHYVLRNNIKIYNESDDKYYV